MTTTAFGAGYLSGMVVAAMIGYAVVKTRSSSVDMVAIANQCATQAAFVSAVGDVIDDEQTHRQIKDRANEILDEHDIPGDPRWDYGGDEQ